MKKFFVVFFLMLFCFGVSANTDTPGGTDYIIEDFNTADCISNIKTNPSDWGILLEWVNEEESGNGSGALNCILDYAYATPEYTVDLVKGRTYKLSAMIKPSHNFLENTFNFWLSGDSLDGSDGAYTMVTVEDVDWRAGEWVKVEALFTWNGRMGLSEVSDENIRVKFRVGSGLFENITGDENIKYSYCMDDFSLTPYIPDFKAKVLGEYKAGEKLHLKCSYDFLYKNVYEEFHGFDNAKIITKVNGEAIKTETAKESVLEITEEYIGKDISFEIYPVVYGKIQEMAVIPPKTVTRKLNFYQIDFFNKVLDFGMTSVKGRINRKIYDDTEPVILAATYTNNTMTEAEVADDGEFEISAGGADEVSAFIWDSDMRPLTGKKSIKTEENSIKLYVDPENGSDENCGNYLLPYKSVQKAKEETARIIEENNNKSGKLKWHFEDGVLRISGTHRMLDYNAGEAPWSACAESVRTLIIDEGVKSIGSNAFYGFYNIKNTVIADSVTEIGYNAFSGCTRLAAVVLSDNVVSIGENAFETTTSVCISQNSVFSGLENYKVYTDGEAVSEYLGNPNASDSEIGWGLYGDCLVISGQSDMAHSVEFENVPWKMYSRQIKTAVIQPGITYTPLNLFGGAGEDGKGNYSSLIRYTVADTVLRISNEEIGGCNALEVFDISDKTETIMHYAAGNKFSIPVKKLVIPKTVKSIGDCAFNNLTELEAIEFEAGFNYAHNGTSEWSSVFRNVSSLKEVVLPKSMESLGSYFISRAERLTDITVLNKDMNFSENCLYIVNEGLVIHGYPGSTAEKFAQEMNYAFEPLSVAYDAVPASEETEVSGSIDKIYVMLRAGEHFIDDTLNFDYTDCSEDIAVEYTSYGDGKAVITGGREITGWEMHDEEKNIYKAYVGKDTDTRQFFVNGVRAFRARSNGGFINYEVDEKGYLCDNTELLDFAHPEDMEILLHVAWTTPRCGVYSVSEEDGRVRVTVKPEAWNILWGRSLESFEQIRPNNPYYYENAYELLDEEGEWYLNKHDGYLYYKPRSFEDIQTSVAVIPITEKLINIEGSKYLGVQNISFDNIEFAYSTWLRPGSDTGHCSNQNNTLWEGDINDMYYPDGAIEVKCAQNIDFTNCTFTKLGTIALKMYGGVHECDIIGNEFYDLSAAAIVVSDRYGEVQTTEDDTYVNRDIKIANNLIHSTGNDFHDSAALTTGYVMNTQIVNNEIFNTSYSAMHLGFVKNENYISGLRVENNYVHDYLKKMADGGGIYFFSKTAGSDANPNIVKNNYVSRGWHGATSICIDYDVSDITFLNNVTDGCNNSQTLDSYAAEWGNGWRTYDFNCGEGHSNLKFINNFGTNGYKLSEAAVNCTVENHTVAEGGVWDAQALEIIENTGVEEEYMHKFSDLPREIDVPETFEMYINQTAQAPYYAYGIKGTLYSGDNLEVYCYSDNSDVVSVENGYMLNSNGVGEANIKMVFKCGTVLREKNMTVTVKPEGV